MTDEPQETTTEEPTAPQQGTPVPVLPPTQFLMFPEGFKTQVADTPIGKCLAITGVQINAEGTATTMEATLMCPLDQVDAFTEMCQREAKAESAPPEIIRASADVDLEALAREARQRSGLGN